MKCKDCEHLITGGYFEDDFFQCGLWFDMDYDSDGDECCPVTEVERKARLADIDKCDRKMLEECEEKWKAENGY